MHFKLVIIWHSVRLSDPFMSNKLGRRTASDIDIIVGYGPAIRHG